jgi:DHA1 family bicyclomycin/chloramphenicol resistance-like MFS transporter
VNNPSVRPTTTRAGFPLLALLIAISAAGPLSVNIIIPALPGIAAALAADPAVVQLTVSLYFAGLASAQLILGSLSDRFGRRPVLLAGFTLTVLTCLAAAAATNIAWLVLARTTQALGAATGVVVGRAIVRDLFERDRAASVLGWVTMSVVAIPMFGPLIGGLIETWWGWRAIFLFIGATTLATLVWAVLALPETRPSGPMASQSGRRMWKEARELLCTPAFAGYVLSAALISGPYYAVTGGGPHVVLTIMGRGPTEFGLWLVFASAGYMAGNFLAGFLSVRYGGHAMLWSGLLVTLAGAALSSVLVAFVPQAGPATIFVPLFVIYVGNGMGLPNAIAGAISVRPQAAGTAAGVTGFVQMGWGALVAQFVAYPLEGAASASPLTVIMLVQALAGPLVFAWLVRPPHKT